MYKRQFEPRVIVFTDFDDEFVRPGLGSGLFFVLPLDMLGHIPAGVLSEAAQGALVRFRPGMGAHHVNLLFGHPVEVFITVFALELFLGMKAEFVLGQRLRIPTLLSALRAEYGQICLLMLDSYMLL